MEKRDDIDERIERMRKLVEAGIDTGYYPRTFLTSGRQQSDREEYGDKYTDTDAKRANRKRAFFAVAARSPVGSDV